MVGSLRKLAARIPGGQKGFTLIEMIVVVGIIAVLAAVIVPNIGKFIGSGEAGAKSAEQESVETAMAAMMADHAVTTVQAGPTTSSNDWSALPVEASADPGAVSLYNSDPALAYLQLNPTVYFYCFDANGLITAQHEVGTTC
jgi:prepilin-type N-terminal cleavage/methylation domain-containing protein